MEPTTGQLPRKFWWYTFLWFTASGLFFSYSVHAEDMKRGHYDYTTAVILELTGYWTIFSLLPLMVAVIRRYPFTQGNWPIRLAQHFVLATLFGVAHTTLMNLTRMGAFALLDRPHIIDWTERFLYEYQKQTMGYTITLGLVHAWMSVTRERQKERERAHLELKSSQLETQLVQSRLQTLEAQLHPHFLFNTLNAVSSLMYEDLDRADKMIADLSRLLRLALEGAETSVVPLSRERQFLHLYLEIMKGRYEDNLIVDLETEAGVEAAIVPNLITQPLVENAIKHLTIGPGRPAHIRVTATRQGQHLQLTVCDNGPGLDTPTEACFGRGTGLANTRARLQTLYGDEGRIALDNQPEGGLRVTLTMPYETVAAEMN